MTPAKDRMRWLDGVRGAAALFVVLHHVWLATWPHFPYNRGPWFVGFLLYGHLAVAVFIVVSGFSLALAPVRHDGELVGGARRFVRRRAWRILPAYWAALILSTIIFVGILEPSTGAGTAARSFGIHAALLQDVFANTPFNGTLWSIAVEWQIYFVFPLILLVARRRGMLFAVTLTAGVVLVAHALSETPTVLAKISHLSPQFLMLFGFGVLAAWMAHGKGPRLSQRAALIGLFAACGTFVALALSQGSPWMAAHWFTVDAVAGVGVACGLLMAGRSDGRWKAATLGSRPAVFIGAFSYSIYLIHGPLLELIRRFVIVPLDLPPLVNFVVLLTCAVPVLLVACYAFFVLFERPFLSRRDFASLRTLPVWTFAAGRWSALRGAPPLAVPATASTLSDSSGNR
jgi:peptidoglycan/LPS O-acetylase OafA/YrhL